MILLTSFFPTLPARAAELEACLAHNAALNCIDKIALLCEKSARPEFTHDKLVCIDRKDRMNFGNFFELANKTYAGQICIVPNADIEFDSTLEAFNKLPETRWNKALFAITRTNENGTLENDGSQDVWVFKSPLSKFDGWYILPGICGCDSLLAQKASEAGLTVQNPALTIKCLHRHKVSEAHNDMLVDTLGKRYCYWSAPGYRFFHVKYEAL